MTDLGPVVRGDKIQAKIRGPDGVGFCDDELAPVIEARHSSRHAESEQKAKQREHGSFNRSNSLVSGIGVPARTQAESRLHTGNYAEEHAHGQGDRPF